MGTNNLSVASAGARTVIAGRGGVDFLYYTDAT